MARWVFGLPSWEFFVSKVHSSEAISAKTAVWRNDLLQSILGMLVSCIGLMLGSVMCHTEQVGGTTTQVLSAHIACSYAFAYMFFASQHGGLRPFPAAVFALCFFGGLATGYTCIWGMGHGVWGMGHGVWGMYRAHRLLWALCTVIMTRHMRTMSFTAFLDAMSASLRPSTVKMRCLILLSFTLNSR